MMVDVDWIEVTVWRRRISWTTLLILCGPTVLLYHLDLDVTYTPRGTLYSGQWVQILLAPWALPQSAASLLSRILQLAVQLTLAPVHSLAHQYIFWIGLALIRTGLGFVLTRSVGWAYPALFSHWALYESSSGWGPSLMAVLSVTPDVPPALLPVSMAASCWLENRPWTYGTALMLSLFLRAFNLVRSSRSMGKDKPLSTEDKLPTSTTPVSPPPSRVSLKSLLLCILPLVPYTLITPSRSPWPATATLDILILSYPRPVDIELDAKIISTTIDSYLPHNPSISIFTHATSHPAFDQLKDEYPNLSFYKDTDDHHEDVQGQALHLAEGFSWWLKDRGADTDWVMLIEDDFPLCPGRWSVVETVMNRLESDRLNGDIRSGFIGTGGSGLIIHKSYLPILIHLLRLHSAKNSILPSDVHRRAPDQIVQDCLLGRPSSLCERKPRDRRSILPFSLFSERGVPQDNGNMIISSRLVLDHIGGMATTQHAKAFNSDKWRCGWRHPFEGDEQVEVVLV
ncbi:hypothetical protein BD324DRAFT_612126 [Kockovaella imperatae]|uniref:Uncharacterized protein n=1 Tax=Kockovaella imperatae TaxID=4999 RepID=A0A1Y1US56_9TREE|nr:hypothetical protein BD324DRAFT_612126 [Kockovaella imperatae]ORX40792.1 hypothetical protein BD324DRAFT_612126 [Kockovaella imperatae]